jgi:hypothetical protein
MNCTFTPLVISLSPSAGFCSVLWADGQRCESADFMTPAEAYQAFNAMCVTYPHAMRVINGEILPQSGVQQAAQRERIAH